MNSEILSLETAEKLARYDKAIKYMDNILKRDVPVQVKVYVNNILNLLEVNHEQIK